MKRINIAEAMAAGEKSREASTPVAGRKPGAPTSARPTLPVAEATSRPKANPNVPAMKALTLQQPFAWAVSVGLKGTEFRSWALPASLVGKPIVIHAGGGLSYEDVLYYDDLARLGAYRGSVPRTDEFDKKAFVAVVIFEACEQAEEKNFHWIIESVVKLEKPVPCLGQLGLWNVPADAAAAIYEQTKNDIEWGL